MGLYESAIRTIIPPNKQKELLLLIEMLMKVRSVQAIVLGGSYARGTAKAQSDIDIGLYYYDADPLDISEIMTIAETVSKASSRPTVTNLYEWGAWVNGGAWIETESGKIDLLYRSLDHLDRVINDSKEGKASVDFLQQPPYGYYSVTYLAETRDCIPLFDPEQIIQRQKEKVAVYPEALRRTIVQENLWNSQFSLLYAKKCAAENDLYTTAGCITRILACLTQVLFSLNRTYFVSDKEAIHSIEHFKIIPNGYRKSVETIFSYLSSEKGDMKRAVEALEYLFSTVKTLASGLFEPKYQIP